jgi:hypothetical protein
MFSAVPAGSALRVGAAWGLGVNDQGLAACSENPRGSGLTFAPDLLDRRHRWQVSIKHLFLPTHTS